MLNEVFSARCFSKPCERILAINDPTLVIPAEAEIFSRQDERM